MLTSVPAMLGMDWLLQSKGYIDFGRLELCVNGIRVKCTGSFGEHFAGQVVVAKTIEIQAGHETIATGAIVGGCEGFKGPLVMEPVDSAGRLGEKGLLMASAVVEMPTEVVPIRLLNPNKEKRVLHAGTTVAVVSPVHVEAPPLGYDTEAEGSTLPIHL